MPRPFYFVRVLITCPKQARRGAEYRQSKARKKHIQADKAPALCGFHMGAFSILAEFAGFGDQPGEIVQ